MKTELTKLVEQLKLNPKDITLFLQIGRIIKQYSLGDKWVPTIVDKNDNSLKFHEVRGMNFIPIFSDEEYIITKGEGVLVTSINKMLAVLINNPDLGGIEIDPFKIGMCIETSSLLQMIFGGYENYQLEKKDWGPGIPKYSQADLLDEKSVLDFAIQAVLEYCVREETITPLFRTNDLDACPNIIACVDGKPSFIFAEGGLYPKVPALSFEKRRVLTERAKHFGYGCYYAPVGFMSCDTERSEKGIALRGDGYYIRFLGLEKVEDLSN